jgi:hypothetical protein
MMYCKEPIKSYSGQIYADQNEAVTIISVSAHVAIVESKRHRFPVLIELLSEDKVVVVVEPDEVKVVDLFNQPI